MESSRDNPAKENLRKLLKDWFIFFGQDPDPVMLESWLRKTEGIDKMELAKSIMKLEEKKHAPDLLKWIRVAIKDDAMFIMRAISIGIEPMVVVEMMKHYDKDTWEQVEKEIIDVRNAEPSKPVVSLVRPRRNSIYSEKDRRPGSEHE